MAAAPAAGRWRGPRGPVHPKQLRTARWLCEIAKQRWYFYSGAMKTNLGVFPLKRWGSNTKGRFYRVNLFEGSPICFYIGKICALPMSWNFFFIFNLYPTSSEPLATPAASTYLDASQQSLPSLLPTGSTPRPSPAAAPACYTWQTLVGRDSPCPADAAEQRGSRSSALTGEGKVGPSEVWSGSGSVAQSRSRLPVEEKVTAIMRQLTCSENGALWEKPALSRNWWHAAPRVTSSWFTDFLLRPLLRLSPCKDKPFTVLIITGNFSAGKKENPCPEEAKSGVLI